MLLQLNTVHAASRQTLLDCLVLGAPSFHRLFSGLTHPLREFRGDLSPLADLGLVEISSGDARALSPVIAFDGLFLKCDPPTMELWERVFPLYDDESLLLARWADVRRGERVLEIGTGAGITALKMAAQGADKVIATDINPRVGDFFTFNAELNGLASKVEYVHSNVFAGVGGERFDIIVSNPPFVPIPREAGYFLHSDGGPFGTSVLESLAAEWRNHMLPGGRLYAMAMSLGSSSEWRLSSMFAEAQFAAIYDTPNLTLDHYFEKFQWVPGQERWRESLCEMRYDRIGYFGLAAGKNTEQSLGRLKAAISAERAAVRATPWSDCSWSMAARLKRYLQVTSQMRRFA